jgi:hypothetical protein
MIGFSRLALAALVIGSSVTGQSLGSKWTSEAESCSLFGTASIFSDSYASGGGGVKIPAGGGGIEAVAVLPSDGDGCYVRLAYRAVGEATLSIHLGQSSSQVVLPASQIWTEQVVVIPFPAFPGGGGSLSFSVFSVIGGLDLDAVAIQYSCGGCTFHTVTTGWFKSTQKNVDNWPDPAKMPENCTAIPEEPGAYYYKDIKMDRGVRVPHYGILGKISNLVKEKKGGKCEINQVQGTAGYGTCSESFGCSFRGKFTFKLMSPASIISDDLTWTYEDGTTQTCTAGAQGVDTVTIEVVKSSICSAFSKKWAIVYGEAGGNLYGGFKIHFECDVCRTAN